MNTPPKASPIPPATDNQPTRLCLESEKILRGQSAVEIEHAGQRYLLRVTRENKLILTK
ncbi:hemin uptake protein HemP [Dechloromonas denitrificans]|uniref:hemin uptake protein HemP n=1 Tax=Dechloromonas denitrificans TaxID=281362 RepID=UPI001CF80EC5|nr:hemin uptake protein HemP [Dechloromonas denitrificans]UCV02610.1 hemin uptake protein HemP [Dechloromonas denitrificans]